MNIFRRGKDLPVTDKTFIRLSKYFSKIVKIQLIPEDILAVPQAK